MKKNSFIEGTLIATLAIILVKILGMLYVIPFYKIVGESGGALYSYAYNIYLIFLSISSAGLPSAISKVISEYNTLNYQDAKKRAYNIAKKIISILAIVAFAILMIFAEEIGRFIIGDLKGINNYQDIAFVIRCVSPAVLIIPFLSITKGLLQGHKFIKPTSIAELIEQLVRIFIILCGSYLCLKVFNGTLSMTIGIAVSGAFFGGLVSYLYLKYIINKNKKELGFNEEIKKEDKVTNKEITKKIIYYAIPFIIISLVTHLYNLTDQILILRTLDKLGYNAVDVEFIASSISTWAPKICTIITALASGMAIALIPHIVSSHTAGKRDEVSNNINKAISIVVCISLPLTLGIFMLNKSTWNIFYSNNYLGYSILAFAVFASLLSNLYLILSSILQSLNRFKFVYIVSLVGFLTNAILDIPMMHLLNKFGYAYLGSILSSVIGYSLSIIIALIVLRKKEKINYKPALKIIGTNLIPSLVMVVVLFILNYFMPLTNFTKLGGLLDAAIKALIAGSIYLIIAYKMNIFNDLLGSDTVNKIIRKITFGKVNPKKEK